jgi:hypothetical protein
MTTTDIDILPVRPRSNLAKSPSVRRSAVVSPSHDRCDPFVDANGLKFAYLEEGSGPLVRMLHAFPDTAHTWDDVRPRVAARGFRAVSPLCAGTTPVRSRIANLIKKPGRAIRLR